MKQTSFDSCNSCKRLETSRLHELHESKLLFVSRKRLGTAVYMSCMSRNFCLFHVSNLSVQNFRIFLLMYPGSMPWLGHTDRPRNTAPNGRVGSAGRNECCNSAHRLPPVSTRSLPPGVTSGHVSGSAQVTGRVAGPGADGVVRYSTAGEVVPRSVTCDVTG